MLIKVILVLGASLHDVLTRLKAEANLFSKLELIFDHNAPTTEPIAVNLPNNGLRLRFDGPEQRLRLVEVLDFTKNQLTYSGKDVFRHATDTPTEGVEDRALGPTFRHIQRSLIGPAFPGEFICPEQVDSTETHGIYVMSYPGIAFSFPIDASDWKAKPDANAHLSASASSAAASMAIFYGESWLGIRDQLFTLPMNPREIHVTGQKSKEVIPEEVCKVKIHGAGKLEIERQHGIAPFFVQLGKTSPQTLVANLGPPDALYRKNDKRMSIHQARPHPRSHVRGYSESRIRDDSTDTDVSSAHTMSDESEDVDSGGEVAGNLTGESFFNYFYHGFDILLAPPIALSPVPPSRLHYSGDEPEDALIQGDLSRMVATKLILHGNVPGSYPFNRHRRCRWEISYLSGTDGTQSINSETAFSRIEHALFDEWKSIYKDEKEAKDRQKAMPLNRDWGNSPDSSIELMGGWEESVGGRMTNSDENSESRALGSTQLYGYPGLLFEVLNNGTVSSLTVF